MRVIRHPDVPQELEAAALWYEKRQLGLGATFSMNTRRRCARILAEPERWRKIRGDNRKISVHRFPYAIVYSVGADAIHIKAVMHLHRRPFYWRGRV